MRVTLFISVTIKSFFLACTCVLVITQNCSSIAIELTRHINLRNQNDKIRSSYFQRSKRDSCSAGSILLWQWSIIEEYLNGQFALSYKTVRRYVWESERNAATLSDEMIKHFVCSKLSDHFIDVECIILSTMPLGNCWCYLNTIASTSGMFTEARIDGLQLIVCRKVASRWWERGSAPTISISIGCVS